MAAKDNMSNQFKTIYHLSESATPPHTVDHPQYGIIDERNLSENRKGSNDVLFGTEEKTLSGLGRRTYAHRYQVPISSISPELYSDDDNLSNTDDNFAISTPDWQKSPQLWQHLPASRTDALKRKTVVRFVNEAESVETAGGLVWNPPSYILPKPHMNELGIKYEGVEEVHGPTRESVNDVEDRVRKSYGPDIK